jgi:HD-GYP domain-containing protein (c-di-GMP phosphodiesterase class II)
MRRFERETAVTDDGRTPGLPQLVEMLGERDPQLSAHAERVAEHAEAIAREMGLPAPAIGRVRLAARLHDLGKLWVDREILEKPGPLTEEEWAQIRRHPVAAARVLQDADLHDVAAIVIAHHERPDGAGYPEQIPSGTTPIEAQIVAVADVYDAMTTYRPYGPTRTHEEACAELVRVSARQLDANVVSAFLRLIDDAPLPQSAAV